MKKYLLAIAAAIGLVSASAQDYQINPQPFGGGWNVSGPRGYQQTIQPQPFGGGYNVQGPYGQSATIQPQPFGGGYTVHTMPSMQQSAFNRW